MGRGDGRINDASVHRQVIEHLAHAMAAVRDAVGDQALLHAVGLALLLRHAIDHIDADGGPRAGGGVGVPGGCAPLPSTGAWQMVHANHATVRPAPNAVNNPTRIPFIT